MCFSSIWTLKLPWLSLLRLKCHSNWSYFCFFIGVCTDNLYSPAFVVIFLEIVKHCPLFRVKISLQNVKNVHHCPALSYFWEKKTCIHHADIQIIFIKFSDQLSLIFFTLNRSLNSEVSQIIGKPYCCTINVSCKTRNHYRRRHYQMERFHENLLIS